MNVAQQAVDAVTVLDADYDTTYWDHVILAQQKVVKQLIADEGAAKLVMELIEGLGESSEVTIGDK